MLEKKYIIVIDSSTSAAKSFLLNKSGEICHKVSLSLDIYYLNQNWCEQDPIDIWQKQLITLQLLKKEYKFKNEEIAAIAITNQRETIISWNSSTNKPLYNAIVWQDRRTEKECEEISKKEISVLIKEKTGLNINPYFSLTKISWLLNNSSAIKESLNKKELMIGTVDSWLIWNMTGGKSFVTDVTNASRTMLFNINTCLWDKEILSLFNIPEEILPEVKSNVNFFGNFLGSLISDEEEDPINIPIYSVMGDQQSSLLGNKCIEEHMTKITHGTGSFLLKNIGSKPIITKNNLITTIAWKINKHECCYAWEANLLNSGVFFNWLINWLNLTHEEIKELSFNKDEILNSMLFFFESKTFNLINNWDFGIRRVDILKMLLKSISFYVHHLLDLLNQDNLIDTKKLYIDGGLSNINYLLDIQSHLSEIEIIRFDNIDMTIMGSFYMCGLSCGWWNKLEDINSFDWKYKSFKNIDNNLDLKKEYDFFKQKLKI